MAAAVVDIVISTTGYRKGQQVERESSRSSANKTSGGVCPSQNHSEDAKTRGGEIPLNQDNQTAGLRQKE